MSDQSLREAQLRQEFRAEIMRGYQAALCNSDVPGWTLGDEVAKVADNLLAAHRAEPAPVVTDEAVEAAAMAVSLDWEKYTASMRTALKAAAPLLGHRPLLDEIVVRNKIADWYGAEWIAKDSTFYETDDTRTLDDPDEGAMHAYRGFQWAQELARPMPTDVQIHEAIDSALDSHAYDNVPIAKITVALLALLNGAES